VDCSFVVPPSGGPRAPSGTRPPEGGTTNDELNVPECWSDLACYAVGVALGVVFDRLATGQEKANA